MSRRVKERIDYAKLNSTGEKQYKSPVTLSTQPILSELDNNLPNQPMQAEPKVISATNQIETHFSPEVSMKDDTLNDILGLIEEAKDQLAENPLHACITPQEVDTIINDFKQ